MKSGKTGRFAIWALIAGVLVLLSSRLPVSHEAVYPVERAKMIVERSVWSRVAGCFAGAAARAENIRLRRQVSELELMKRDVVRLEEENARLRRSLGYLAKGQGKWLAAGVLSSGGGAAGAHGSLRVDKGSLAGVAEGAIVVVPEGLVGRVAVVSPHTAEVRLITDPSVKVACKVEGALGVQGILCGGSDGGLLLRYLRNAERASPHSRVLTSGLGGVFPPDLAVGTLLRVTNGVRDSEGEVQPQVEFSALEDVFIRCGQ